MTSRARADSLHVWRRLQCDSNIGQKVQDVVRDIADFGKKLANDLTDFINSLPTPSQLMDMAVDFVKEKVLSGEGLCVRPYCRGGHINSGMEKDLVPQMKHVEILASHHTAPATPRATIRPPPTRSNISTHASPPHNHPYCTPSTLPVCLAVHS